MGCKRMGATTTSIRKEKIEKKIKLGFLML